MATVYIKNMVCNRCIMVVRSEVEKSGLEIDSITFGEVVTKDETISPEVLESLKKVLIGHGFEIIDDSKVRLIERIKAMVIQIIHRNDTINLKTNWSDLITEGVPYEYNYISNLFSGIAGITLEQYIIRQRVERVKELLLYDELTLSQIADKLGYSSVAHLSAQFKKVTGFTPSELKKSRSLDTVRKSLDAVS